MELTRHELDCLHDVVLDTSDINLDSDEKIQSLYNKLPLYIQLEAEYWGLTDTIVKNKIYKYLEVTKIEIAARIEDTET